MAPSLATRLTVHDPELAGTTVGSDRLTDVLEVAQRTTVRVQPRRQRFTGRAAIHRRTLAAADMLAAVAALAGALALTGAHVGPGVLVIAPLTILLFKVAGLYDQEELRLTSSTIADTPMLAQLAALMTLATAVTLGVLGNEAIAGEQLAALWVAFAVALVLGRIGARALAGAAAPVERCLVMGTAARIDQIREKLERSRVSAAIVATLPVSDDEIAGAASVAAVRQIVRDLRLDRLIIAPGAASETGMGDWIRVAKAAGLPVSVQPRLLDAVGSSFQFEDVDGMSMLGVRRFGLARSSRAVKRSFDLVMTGAGVLLISPLLAAIALAIRLDSSGPVFYRQIRVGRDGRHFSIFKFRSMRVGAHAERELLRDRNEAGHGLFKVADDPRVTRVGRVLRRSSLDELPQVLNVLRGEMSLVGPRPLVVDEDAQVLGLDRSRLHLTPGMTGPWQVLDARVPMQEMVALDYLYVTNWSLWLDVELLIRTVRHVMRGGNL